MIPVLLWHQIIYSRQFQSGYQYRSRYRRKSLSRVESGKAMMKREHLKKPKLQKRAWKSLSRVGTAS